MRLTSFTDFALRALMRLAGEPARSFATNEIAAEFKISRNHLAKVVRDLADGGFITTQRGVGGGFSLARPPHAITLGEVVRALEGEHALVECFRDDGGACALTPTADPGHDPPRRLRRGPPSEQPSAHRRAANVCTFSV